MPDFFEISDLRKSFDKTDVINGFSLSVIEGTLQCLVGPNGAGKTTTIDLISGRLKPTSGKILFKNEDITGMSEHEIARRGFGRKFQIPAVFRDMSVQENLEVAYSLDTSAIRGLFTFRVPKLAQRIEDVAEEVGLSHRLDVIAGNLSHGETQWLEIGMVLMQDPSVLLMDEPVAGMTEQEINKTADMFKRLKRNHTLIVVEHDMGFVREIADTVTVMHFGALLAQGSIREIEENEKVRDVYLGTEEVH